MRPCDVLIRGDGIVGRTLALALARIGVSVALRGDAARRAAPGDDPSRAARGDDVRAFALNAGSVALLESLKVWPALPDDARTAVFDMRVRGDAAGGAIEFSAFEQRTAELATIVDAAALEEALEAAIGYAPHIRRVDEDVPATLVVHAEGKAAATALRAQGVGVDDIDYGQRAIAARLVSTERHAHVAHQWFESPGVLALLPFDRPEPQRSYALVWSLPEARAGALLAADRADFEAELNAATRGEAGPLALASARAAWPLAARSIDDWCGPGWVLVGDAAHLVHPLAGQGLNLGLADVAALAQTLAAREPWRSIGDERLLRRYVRRRAAPTWAMLRITDGLLRLFGETASPVAGLRNNAMSFVNRVPPLKRWLTARALDSEMP